MCSARSLLRVKGRVFRNCLRSLQSSVFVRRIALVCILTQCAERKSKLFWLKFSCQFISSCVSGLNIYIDKNCYLHNTSKMSNSSHISESEPEKQISFFSAGPAKLPHEVLVEIQKELVYYGSTSVSVMEMSHRSKDFDKIIKGAESIVKELLNVPDNYKILFLQGGGMGQFSAVPLNLLSSTGKADYIVTGSWSSSAAKECEKYGEVHSVLPPAKKFRKIPSANEWNFSNDASYIYYCANETVDGVEFQDIPEVPKGVPLVCDMSSNICSRSFDVSKFGVVYGGAQKNIGCAGVTLIIIREDLLGKTSKHCPKVLDYTVMAKNRSLLNTPPTFAIYVLERVLSWVKRNGGVDGMEKNAIEKSEILYSLIDKSSEFYCNLVDPACRSRMNVVFRIGGPEGNETLEEKFLEEASKEGLLALKGHRSVGGIRASLYNAITVQDVSRLANFMERFMAANKN